jgi:5-methylthioadenosine/S-adenosylhomocysteine deaminase
MSEKKNDLTVISNTTIVTCNTEREIIYDGAIAIAGSAIIDIGSTKNVLGKNRKGVVIDGKGKAVFPGLVNCHAHLTANLFRGITEDFGFPTSFRFPEDPREIITDEQAVIMALLGAIESVRSGCTTVVEIASGIDRYVEDLQRFGTRWVLAENTADGVVPRDYRPGEPVLDYSDNLRDISLERATRSFEKWHTTSDSLISCMGSTGLVETSSPRLLSDMLELVERYESYYTIHLNQSRMEVEALLAMRGVRPTQSLFENDYLGPKFLGAHARFLDNSEISLLGRTRSNISHQPAMAARRAVIPPVYQLEKAGCSIGLGTDNNTQDMIEVMRVGLFTERIDRSDGAVPQPEDYLEMATMGSASAIGLDHRIGSLEIGKQADLFMVNTLTSNLVPTMRLVSGLIHNGHPGNIESVMVNGEFVLMAGKILNVDEAAIISEADRIGKKVWSYLVEQYPQVKIPIKLAP